MRRWLAVLVVIAAAASCDDHHAGDGGHAHGDHAHGEEGHGEHGHDEHGHDDHGHGHGDEAIAWTHFGATTQLFAEYSPLTPSKESEFLIHLTALEGWRAIEEGAVVLELRAGDAVATSGPVKASRPGVFRAKLQAPPGSWGHGFLTIRLDGPVADSHGTEVHAGPDEHAEPEATDPIAFPLEQQWAIEFGMKRVETRRIRKSFDAFGTLRPRIGGEGVVHAPVAGRVFGDDLPMLGTRVEAGQELAWLLPALADQGDVASFDLALSQAQVQLRAATADRQRLEGLVRDGVVPERRLAEARFAEEQAQASLAAARRRQGQARGASGTRASRSQGGIALKAPLTGVVVAVDVPPGLYVESGQAMFRIVDPDPLWLEVEIPEVHVPHVANVAGVWFEVEGYDDPFEVGSEQVWVGGVVDPHSRTLPLIVTVPNADGRLRPGMFANAHVIEQVATDATAVPREAIVIEDGIPVVFVAASGESFERRAVRLGARDGGFVEVLDGVKPGEWVVTAGSYAVRLAALGDQANVGHGHAH